MLGDAERLVMYLLAICKILRPVSAAGVADHLVGVLLSRAIGWLFNEQTPVPLLLAGLQLVACPQPARAGRIVLASAGGSALPLGAASPLQG